MNIETKITNHYRDRYQSSPICISKKEVSLLMKHNCSCDNCGKSIFELEDFPNLRRGEVLCEECWKGEYMLTCPICEDYFEKALKPKDEVLIISKEAILQYSMGDIKPGFYQVKEWPYYFGNILTGFEGLYESAICLIREVDINSMLYKLQPHNGREKVDAQQCCRNCMEKYTGKSRIKNNYCDRAYGKVRVKFEKKVIADGC